MPCSGQSPHRGQSTKWARGVASLGARVATGPAPSGCKGVDSLVVVEVGRAEQAVEVFHQQVESDLAGAVKVGELPGRTGTRFPPRDRLFWQATRWA